MSHVDDVDGDNVPIQEKQRVMCELSSHITRCFYTCKVTRAS